MGRQRLLLSRASPARFQIMKEWRYGRDHSTIRLSLIFLIFLNFLDFSTAFDCRVFIFHPECRGSYGKRTTNSPMIPPPDHLVLASSPKPATNIEANKKLVFSEYYPVFGSGSEIRIFPHFLIPNNNVLQKTNEVDLASICSRYVFAPVCRGVTSKRSDPTLTQQNRLYYSILQQMRDSYDQSKLDDENHSSIQVDVPTAVKKPFNFENLNLRGNHHRGKRDLGDDLGTFTGFLKRDFYYYPLKSLEKSSLRSKRNEDDDLGSFSNFFKRNSGSGGHDELGSFSNFLKKRSAFPDLGGFSNFLKKSHRFKRERGGMSPFEELGRFPNFYKKRSDLESFSTFNGGKRSGDLESFSTFSKRPKPLQYGKRSAGNNDLESFSTFGKRSLPDDLEAFSTFGKKRSLSSPSSDLEAFSTFGKRSGGLGDLESFSTFNGKRTLKPLKFGKRSTGNENDLEAFSTLGKRSAGDLESFSTFGKRSASSTQYEDLDGFSGFMTKRPDVDFSQ